MARAGRTARRCVSSFSINHSSSHPPAVCQCLFKRPDRCQPSRAPPWPPSSSSSSSSPSTGLVATRTTAASNCECHSPAAQLHASCTAAAARIDTSPPVVAGEADLFSTLTVTTCGSILQDDLLQSCQQLRDNKERNVHVVLDSRFASSFLFFSPFNSFIRI